MCAYEPSYVCSKCSGTPHDSHYEQDEPVTPEPFYGEDGE